MYSCLRSERYHIVGRPIARLGSIFFRSFLLFLSFYPFFPGWSRNARTPLVVTGLLEGDPVVSPSSGP